MHFPQQEIPTLSVCAPSRRLRVRGCLPPRGGPSVRTLPGGVEEAGLMFNGANTGFMLLAASLVMLMTPGLAFFYGGLVGRSKTLTIMIQSFAAMGITTIMWGGVGFSRGFTGGGRA